MIYNSNGNNTPYQSGGNAKVNKQLRALEESIDNVTYRLNGYVGTDDTEINGMIGDALDNIREDVDNAENAVANLGPRVSGLENTINGYSTKIVTSKVQAQDADFHKVVAGKYVFQNGVAITGTNICKIADGSVVYATDGTNAILIDYTNKDAWVAKAKTQINQKFRIYSNGVLTFTQSGGWNVYVLGNDFSTNDFSVPTETPIDILTGVTIGGTLYAALARDYEFDNITVTSATINSATVTLLTAPNATITDLTATNETVADLTVTDEADINNLVNAKRNIQDEINGMISVGSHPTNVKVYIGVHKFTGTYNLKLTHNINGSIQTLFTATIIWNGKYPIVQYHEYADNEPVDYLYSMVLTDDALYFVTQGAGNLYYSYDAMGGALAPTSSEYPNIPYQPNDVIADYITAYHDRTVFFGNHEDESGIDVLGEMKADIIQLPDDFSITNMYVDNDLVVGGSTTLTGDTTAGNITADKIESDELIGKSLQVKDGTDTYMAADENGVTVNVDTTINGDLIQTGDQNITGSVEISEKEIINNIPASTPGYNVSYDYWLHGTNYYKEDANKTGGYSVISNSQVHGNTTDSVLLAENVVRLYRGSVGYDYSLWQAGYYASVKPYYYIINNVYYDYTSNSNRYVIPTEINADNVIVEPTNRYYYVKPVDANNNAFYLYWKQDSSTHPNAPYYDYCRGIELTYENNAAEIAELNTKTFVLGSFGATKQNLFKPITSISPTGITLGKGQPEATNASGTPRFYSDQHNLYYVPHNQFIAEADPNHTYDTTNEVLAVMGSEKVTRDLKVQGFIYQDEYNRAVLPNINANTINSNGGVLIIGDLD